MCNVDAGVHKVLDDLIAAVEAGTAVPLNFICLSPEEHRQAFRAYNGSLDAAKALHEALLPDWDVSCLDQAIYLAGAPWGCEVAYFNGSKPSLNRKAYSRHDFASPARAWLLAILKAYREIKNG